MPMISFVHAIVGNIMLCHIFSVSQHHFSSIRTVEMEPLIVFFAIYTVVVRGWMVVMYQGLAVNDRYHSNAVDVKNSVV